MKPLITILVAALVALANLPARAVGAGDLPDIGGSPGVAISLADEYQIGRMVVRGLRDQDQIFEDPEVSEYIQSLGLRLSSQALQSGVQFQFFIGKEPEINAFALPGGFIVVYPDLILATKSESELAGVMAHEISHVTQRHYVRSIAAQSHNNIVSTAAMLAAILVGAAAGGDAAIAGLAAAQSVALQQQMSYSRSEEFEADALGISLMSHAGFDPNGMWAFFETIDRQSGREEAQIPAILRNHPVTSDRISDARARAAKLGSVLANDSLSYQLTKERLRVLLTPRGKDPRDYYASPLTKEISNTPAFQYGRGLALVSAGVAKEAVPIFTKLLASDSTVVQYHTALGQAQLQAGNGDASLATFERASKLFPRNVPVTVHYAEALMRVGKSKQAHEVLLDLFNNVEPTPAQAKLIALAANSAGDVADSYYYMSEYHIMGGDLQLAMSQLQLALSVPNLTSVQRARFQSRLEEIQQAMPRKALRQASDDDGSGGGGGKRGPR